MRNKFYLALVLVAVMCFAGWTAHARLQKNTSAKQTWEYLIVELKDPATPTLDQHGAAGWELIDVVVVCTGTTQPTCTYSAYMKRAKLRL